jgi:hypothetical protein
MAEFFLIGRILCRGLQKSSERIWQQ